MHAASDVEDDDVLDHVSEETTVDWCKTLNKVLYEWQVNYNTYTITYTNIRSCNYRLNCCDWGEPRKYLTKPSAAVNVIYESYYFVLP